MQMTAKKPEGRPTAHSFLNKSTEYKLWDFDLKMVKFNEQI